MLLPALNLFGGGKYCLQQSSSKQFVSVRSADTFFLYLFNKLRAYACEAPLRMPISHALLRGNTNTIYNYLNLKTLIMRKFTFKSLLIAAALCLGTSARADTGSATVKMTYVDYDSPTTAIGEIPEGETARSGYNKISGGYVGFANIGWGKNCITYIQVDASGINGKITGAKLTADISGSTDSKRTTEWGVGYNSSVWSADMTFDSADKTITTLGGTQWSSSKGSADFTTRTFDITAALENDDDKIVTLLVYEKQAAGGYIKNPTVSVEYIPAGAKVANYKVIFVCNGNEIKTPITSSGLVGDACTIDSELLADFMLDDGTMKYIYVGNDAEDKTIAEDGETVVTINYREAETYSYTINATDGANVIAEIKSGSYFEGETIKYAYSKYVNKEGTLYTKGAVNNEYNGSFKLTENNQVVNLAYAATDITNVEYWSEAEDIAGMTIITEGNTSIRSSASASAYAAKQDVVFTTLPAGKYKITVNICDAAGKNPTGTVFNFKAGESVLFGYAAANINNSLGSGEFNLVKDTQISIAQAGRDKVGIDYIYIQRIGEATTTQSVTVGSNGIATYTPSVALDFTNATNIKAYTASVSETTVTLTETKTVAAGEGVIIKSVNGGEATEEIAVANPATATEGNALVGTLVDIALATTDGTYNNYILNVVNGKLGFYQANNKKVAAGKAYLQVRAAETVEGAKTLTIVWNDGETTGIEENYEFGTMNSDAATFDLSGRKVANPAKGLYIKNGKKFIVK